jgi:integrase
MDAELDAFHAWLVGRGRADKTASDRWQVGRCLATRKLTDRLLDRKLSPNSRRLCLASLRAWARFGKDAALLAELDDIKLPPPERVLEKVPMEEKAWRRLLAAIDQDDEVDDFGRACLLLVARRGLRAGAVSALLRKRVVAGLKEGVLVFGSKGRQLRYGVKPILAQLHVMLAEPRKWTVAADILAPKSAPEHRITRGRVVLWENIRRIATRIGEDGVYPHRLRRTYATIFLKRLQGDPESLVKLRAHMSWTSIQTAVAYVDHARREELDDVALDLLND